MRPVRYSVAMSLDGSIAGPGGEYDWIPEEPAIDWGAFLERFDTVLMGRKTFEVSLDQGGGEGGGPSAGMRTLVFSRTLRAEDHPGVEIVAEDAAAVVEAFRREEGKEIWLMGGGELAASLLDAGLMDFVEAAVVPILLGGGIPFLPGLSRRTTLTLIGREECPSGIVLLTYAVCARSP